MKFVPKILLPIVAKQFTLGKHERLKSRKSIEQLFTEGKKIVVAPYRVSYMLHLSVEGPALLFGAGVSAKNFKKAVDRNRVKRLIREAWRLQKNYLQEIVKAKNIHLHVFFIYTGKELPVFDDTCRKVGAILKKLQKLVDP
jgi:ribonuclease P protein component